MRLGKGRRANDLKKRKRKTGKMADMENRSKGRKKKRNTNKRKIVKEEE